jgi:hypothetical protein
MYTVSNNNKLTRYSDISSKTLCETAPALIDWHCSQPLFACNAACKVF